MPSFGPKNGWLALISLTHPTHPTKPGKAGVSSSQIFVRQNYHSRLGYLSGYGEYSTSARQITKTNRLSAAHQNGTNVIYVKERSFLVCPALWRVDLLSSSHNLYIRV